MKFTSLRAFIKHVEGAEKAGFSPLYLILSPEGGEGRMAIEAVVEALARKEKIEAMGIRSLGADSSLLEEEINTLNLFSPKRIVTLGGAGDLPKALEERLLKPLPPGVFVILHGKGASAFYKKVEKVGIVAELGAEKSWEKEKNAQEWVIQRFAEEKKKIEPLAAQLLAKDSGGEIALLEQEIEKLMLYTYGKEMVTRQDVTKLCISRPVITVFNLAESLFKRDIPSAVRQFRMLLDEGHAYFAILKQLRSQILTDLEIASILKNGGNVGDVTKAFPYIKGFILEKHLETIRIWGFSGLKRALVMVDDYEIRGKDGTSDYELLGDLFILKLAG